MACVVFFFENAPSLVTSLDDADTSTIGRHPESDIVLTDPSVSTRHAIIKHREKLGGFIHIAQLNEVYGLKPEVIPLIWDYFDFDAAPIRKLSINSAPVEELSSHPYISYQEAKVIVAYRLQHGGYQTATDLLGIKIFKSDWVEKISPYLSFETIGEKAGKD